MRKYNIHIDLSLCYGCASRSNLIHSFYVSFCLSSVRFIFRSRCLLPSLLVLFTSRTRASRCALACVCSIPIQIYSRTKPYTIMCL